MAGICGNQPAIIALVKITGPSLGIVAAAFAWIANNFISWCAWQIGRSIKRYDTMKALRAEISSNSQSEQNYADPEAAEALIASLRADIGPLKPLIPYVAVIDRNVVFDNVSASLSLLPAKAAADVVAYYNLTGGLTAQLMDFRSETFARLSHERQKAVIRRLFILGAQVAAAASVAQETLELGLRRYWLTALSDFICAYRGDRGSRSSHRRPGPDRPVLAPRRNRQTGGRMGFDM
jgi:hypothetical protein